MSRLITLTRDFEVSPPGTLTSESSTPRKRAKPANENLVKDASSPFRNITNVLPSNGDKTPPKKRLQYSTDPATPTTNMKMLVNVALRENYEGSDSISNSSVNSDFTLAEREGEEKLDDNNKVYCEIASSKISRKQRSLAFMCDRFLSSFPEDPDENEDLVVSIDEAASVLGVERRRMYDIVNVLESIEIVKKTAKNKYRYYGKRNLLSCLRKLSIRAREENLKQHLEIVTQANQGYAFENTSENFIPIKRERTLGGTSQKFLMLFLASTELCSISLQVAAQVLMGKFTLEEEAVQFKTKIRRLYDIANIFMSVGLIEKDKYHGKQSFKYIGPSLQYLQNEWSDIKDSSVTKDLPPVTAKQVEIKHSVPITSSVNTFVRAKSENWNSVPKAESTQRKFVRHSSLHDICAAAEIERQKLYSSLCSASNTSTINHVDNQQAQNFTTPPVQDRLSKISHINVITLKKATSNLAPETKCLSSSIQTSSPSSASELCQLVKKNIVADQLTSKVENSEVKQNHQKVISLTSEQGRNILKFLDVSLKDGQTATILIGGGNNVGNQDTSSQMSVPNGYILQDNVDYKHISLKSESAYDNSANCSNITACDKELVDVDSNTSNSSPNEFSVLTANSIGTPSGASPISIPSGYATPSISHIGDTTFLPNQEVAEVLKTMEKCNSEFQFVLPGKKAYTSQISHVENFNLKNKSLVCRAAPNKTEVTNNMAFLHENSTSSSDSTNEEIQVIMQQKHEPSVVGDKVFLLDEKTICSPITIQENVRKTPCETSIEQKRTSKHLPVTLPVPTHMLYSTDVVADSVLLVPVSSPNFSNIITCLQYPVQAIKSQSTVIPSHVPYGHSFRAVQSAFSPVYMNPVFKQPRKIVSRKLSAINADTLP